MATFITCSKGTYDDHIHIEWHVEPYAPGTDWYVRLSGPPYTILVTYAPANQSYDWYITDDTHFSIDLRAYYLGALLASDTGWVAEHSSSESSVSSLSSSSLSSVSSSSLSSLSSLSSRSSQSSSSSSSSSSISSSSSSSISSSSSSSISSLSSSSISSLSSSSISSSSSSSSTAILGYSSLSSSSSSISSSSSKSSSSFVGNRYPLKNFTYLSTCQNKNSITNPSVGWDANMGYIGYFDKSEPTIFSKHIEKHGLVRNNANKGMVFCQNAGKLFYMKAGGVSLTLSLPYNITNGIYEPLMGNVNCVVKDMLMWGVNVGELYITPPGLYAAFTPYGIEFTLWSSKGRFSIIDTITTIAKNTDFTIDFAWNKHGVLTSFDANMVLFCNNVLTAWEKCLIGNDNLSYLYKIGDKIKGANFCLMGNLFKKIGLEGTVRRIETYTTFSAGGN